MVGDVDLQLGLPPMKIFKQLWKRYNSFSPNRMYHPTILQHASQIEIFPSMNHATAHLLPPEVLFGGNVGVKVDIWMLGLLVTSTLNLFSTVSI